MKTRFKRILDEKGLTAKMASEKIGINASCISHLLNGNRKPSFEVIEKISRAFPDINMNWFIHGEGMMYIPVTKEIDIKTDNMLIDMHEKTEPQTVIPSVERYVNSVSREDKKNRRTLKRILLFFDDGSFEEYSC